MEGRGAVLKSNASKGDPPPREREHCRGYTARMLPCMPVLQRRSAVLSLFSFDGRKWRAITKNTRVSGVSQ